MNGPRDKPFYLIGRERKGVTGAEDMFRMFDRTTKHIMNNHHRHLASTIMRSQIFLLLSGWLLVSDSFPSSSIHQFEMAARSSKADTSDASPWDSIVSDYETRVEPFTASFVEEMLQPFLDSSAVRRSQTPTSIHLLDVGCGTGAATLYARKQGLRVTATDASPVMLHRLRQRHADMYGNDSKMLEVVVADGQQLPPSWTDKFDFAVGAFSVIFFPNVSRGLQEMCRCLVPGTGQMVLSAWGSAEETPAFQIFPDAVRTVAPRLLESSKPKRIAGSPAGLKALLQDAGLENIRIVGPVRRILRVPSAEAYFDRFALGSPNTKTTISKMTNDEVRQLKAKVVELVEKRGGGKPDGSVEIPSNAYFAYGTKPS